MDLTQLLQATFSDDGTYFLRHCSGPKVPHYEVRNSKTLELGKCLEMAAKMLIYVISGHGGQFEAH